MPSAPAPLSACPSGRTDHHDRHGRPVHGSVLRHCARHVGGPGLPLEDGPGGLVCQPPAPHQGKDRLLASRCPDSQQTCRQGLRSEAREGAECAAPSEAWRPLLAWPRSVGAQLEGPGPHHGHAGPTTRELPPRRKPRASAKSSFCGHRRRAPPSRAPPSSAREASGTPIRGATSRGRARAAASFRPKSSQS